MWERHTKKNCMQRCRQGECKKGVYYFMFIIHQTSGSSSREQLDLHAWKLTKILLACLNWLSLFVATLIVALRQHSQFSRQCNMPACSNKLKLHNEHHKTVMFWSKQSKDLVESSGKYPHATTPQLLRHQKFPTIHPCKEEISLTGDEKGLTCINDVMQG